MFLWYKLFELFLKIVKHNIKFKCQIYMLLLEYIDFFRLDSVRMIAKHFAAIDLKFGIYTCWYPRLIKCYNGKSGNAIS